MNYRRLGSTGLSVSELGFGAWGIGKTMWLGADDDESLRCLRRAIDAGVNFIDTALGYGDGHSERLVGQAVRDAGGEVYVASKIPPKNLQWPAQPGVTAPDAFPADWVVACTEASLANLGLEAIDVQQFHVWSDEWLGQGDWADAVAKLREQGKIRHFGVSINDHQPSNAIQLVKSGLVDTVQVIYNVFDQSPEDALFDATQAANVGVIVRVPLDEGPSPGGSARAPSSPKATGATATSVATGGSRCGTAFRRSAPTLASPSTACPRLPSAFAFRIPQYRP